MAAQRQLATFVAAEIGFDWTAGRLDRSTHPFCTGIDRRDVRLTWRGQEEDLRQALMGVLHEMGHGLYDQGLPAEWESTPLGEPASTGVHESQSRLWGSSSAAAARSGAGCCHTCATPSPATWRRWRRPGRRCTPSGRR